VETIVRVVDVGSGNTKFVTGVVGDTEIRCASVAYPSNGESSSAATGDRRAARFASRSGTSTTRSGLRGPGRRHVPGEATARRLH
jgi:hypothetical protein